MRHIKKIFFGLLPLLFTLIANAQHVDRVINMGVYKSYFCDALHDPLYVTYFLQYGAGECGKSFSFSSCGETSAVAGDYYDTGYDRGHLANAEDFSATCELKKATYCYFNCLPQTPGLNRGSWREFEKMLRQRSVSEELFIISGGIFSNKFLPDGHQIGIPDWCYKIVYRASDRQLIFCQIFNNHTGENHPILKADLDAKLGYRIDLNPVL